MPVTPNSKKKPARATWKTVATTLALFLITPILSTSAQTAAGSSGVVSRVPIALEVVNSRSLCGHTLATPSERICIGNNPNETSVNDTVGKLKRFLIGSGQFCGIDERGVRCWGTQNRYEMSIQKILESGIAEKVRLTVDKICIPKTDQRIYCYSPEQNVWVESVPGSGNRDRSVRQIPPLEVYGPFADLRDFQVTSNEICILDGEHVSCQKFKSNQNTGPSWMPKIDRAFPGAKALAMNANAYCVLYDHGVDCFRMVDFEKVSEYELRGRWEYARELFGMMGHESVCALSAEGDPLCATFGVNSHDLTDGRPADFLKPGITVKNFKASGDSRCAVLENAKDGTRDLYCGSFTSNGRVGSADQFLDFAVAGEAFCTLDKKFVVNCFYSGLNLDSPLPEDGSPTHAAGKCRWNNSRFHCSTTDMKMDFSEIRHVVSSTKNSEDLPFPCIVFENRDGLRQATCLSSVSIHGSQGANAIPALISPTNDKIEATFNYGCVYGEGEPNCWGDPLGGVRPPNLSNVKKMEFRRDFGCALDQFGFLCWGDRLEERQLGTPAGLTDLDAVRDFAIGSNHICAITRDQTVQCWGLNDSLQLESPQLTNPISIAAFDNTTCATADEGVVCWGEREEALLTPHRRE